MIEHLRKAWATLTAPGAPYEMIETVVGGVPMRTFVQAAPDLKEIWLRTAVRGSDTYLVYEDEHYSYDEVHALVRHVADVLNRTYGVGHGDRVAIAMRNYPEWVIAYWATVSLGAAVVGMNAWWTGPEMEYALTDSTPTVLICDDERLERVLPHLDGLRARNPLALITVRTQRPLPSDAVRWNDVISAASAPDTLPDVEIDPDDDATIFYTSGTTGFPKGARLTHRGTVHNVMHMVFWPTVNQAAQALAVEAGDLPAPREQFVQLPPRPVYMAPTPLFHVTACNCLMHPCTVSGGKLVLTYKWDPARALELIERERVTNFSAVPTMSRDLLAHPDWERRDTSSLRGMGGGGAPLQPELARRIDAALERGVPTTGYGLTETTGIITANSAHFLLTKAGSCGPVMPTLDAKLVDEDGRDLEPGPSVIGQLCVRGPLIVKGYLNQPEATLDAIRDGWFRTGDVARIDEDGFVFLVDRAKDMVLRGGENVYSSEVEAALHSYAGVEECAVFGIPHERLGEEVAAAVVPTPGHQLDQEELRAHLEVLIARHKIPTQWWFLDDPLPRNATGKIVKRELKERLLASE